MNRDTRSGKREGDGNVTDGDAHLDPIGDQKLFGVLSTFQPAAGTQIWFGGIIELVTGLAIAAGALTTWAAFLASGTMAVAYVQFHWKLAFDARFFPTVNEGELALLCAAVFLYIACRGGGAWSVDRWRVRPTGTPERER